MPPRSSPPRPRQRAAISGQLHAILTRGEHNLYEVAKAAKVPLSSLTRFVDGERGLTLATADKLADALGLKLVETGRDRVRTSKSPRPRSARGEPHGDPRRLAETAGGGGTMGDLDASSEEAAT